MDRQITALMTERNHLRLSAETFCCLMSQIDAMSDPLDVEKVEHLLASAMHSFDDGSVFLKNEFAEN